MLIAIGVNAGFIVLLIGLAGLAYAFGLEVSVGFFTRDVTSLAEMNPLAGCISQLGAVLWAAAAAVCGLSALQQLQSKSEVKSVGFFFWAFVITTALLVDDLFLFHELMHAMFGVWVELLVLSILAGAVLVFLFVYRRMVFASRHVTILLVSCGLFAAMVVVDGFQESIESWGVSTDLRLLLEDGTKFMGICAWLVWLTCSSLEHNRNRSAL